MVLIIWLLWSAAALGAKPAKSTEGLSAFEIQVFRELNAVRKAPALLVTELREIRERIQGNQLPLSPTRSMTLQEGRPAVDQAIEALQKASPVPELTLSMRLTRAARDHQHAQQKSGEIGHYGKVGDTPERRLAKRGNPIGKHAENLSYGPHIQRSAKETILTMIIDDGVPGRGHRHNILDPNLKLVGLACGPHPKHQFMCVIDFATDLLALPRTPATQKPRRPTRRSKRSPRKARRGHPVPR